MYFSIFMKNITDYFTLYYFYIIINYIIHIYIYRSRFPLHIQINILLFYVISYCVYEDKFIHIPKFQNISDFTTFLDGHGWPPSWHSRIIRFKCFQCVSEVTIFTFRIANWSRYFKSLKIIRQQIIQHRQDEYSFFCQTIPH